MFEILAAVATWRLTALLYAEDGPWGIFLKIRRSFKSHDNAFECFWCLSMWVAIPFALAMSTDFLSFFIRWLAYSGIAILMETVIDKLDV